MITSGALAMAAVLLVVPVPASAAQVVELGIISTFAGNGVEGSDGDGGPATSAKVMTPADVAVDAAGNAYIAERWASKVRKVAPDGTITTFAGTGEYGSGDQDGIPATQAKMKTPSSVAVDQQGNVYIADTNDSRVRRVTPDGLIRTIAGTGVDGFNGDGGLNQGRQLNGPSGLAVDSARSMVYVTDRDNHRIRRIDPVRSVIATVAGTGVAGSAANQLRYPNDVAVDDRLDLYIADTDNHRVQKWINASSEIRTLTSQVRHPSGIALDSAAAVFVSDTDNHRILRIPAGGVPGTVAGTGVGGYLGDNGKATEARLNKPTGVFVTKGGDFYIADEENHRVRKVTGRTLVSIISTTTANLSYPNGVAVDGFGNVYVSDQYHHRVLRIDAQGNVGRIAGTGVRGYNGDRIPATEADLDAPRDVAVDRDGNVYIADGPARVRKVDTDGYITTFAGNGEAGFRGDGGPAGAALLFEPQGLAVDQSGNVYIAEVGNNRVRRVDTQRIITTVAGDGGTAYNGDGRPAVTVSLKNPTGVAFDDHGNMFVSEGCRIRKVDAAGTISIVAGKSDQCGDGEDNMPATATILNSLSGLAVDGAGNIYLPDWCRVRRVDTTGIITTLAGRRDDGCGYAGDGGLAVHALLGSPGAVAVDPAGHLYIADTNNNRIRQFAVF